MTDRKAEYASLSLDFLKTISEESKRISTIAGELIEDAEKCALVGMVSAELVMIKISLGSLSHLCVDAMETCVITDRGIVQVPADMFIKIADSSGIGMSAVQEASKYISFSLH